ncbi:MAG: hypothetical protein MJ153_08380 [Clostridia bacterium]|nr:hypothetical protein [Clostridia bacterium]
MVKRKYIALFLATAVCASVISVSACSGKNSENENNSTEVETTVETAVETEISESDEVETSAAETAMTTETSAPETSITETSAETTEETEISEKTSDIISSDAEASCPNESNEADAAAYELFMDFVQDGSFDSNAEFAFECLRYGSNDPVDSRWGLVVKTGDDMVSYAVIKGQVKETSLGHDWYPHKYLSREDFLQLPIMLNDISGKFGSSDDIENGTYYGWIYCTNTDGTQLLAEIAFPVIIDSSTYEGLSDASEFTDIYGETYTLESEYNEDENEIIDESGEILHGWFTPDEDGNYRFISDSFFTPTHNGTLCFIDIADDCVIEDTFAWLMNSGEPTVGFNPDEPFTFRNSHFYNYVVTYILGNVYNGWAEGGPAILEPVTVEDGQIVSMVIGFR